MEVAILNIEGNDTGRKVVLNNEVFGIEPNDHAIYLDVKQFLANQRQGTHSSLERSMVSGSTKKLHRQKGTGGSRKGSVKSGTRVGGARIFGPQPRNYSFKLNKKLKQLARMSALAYKAKDSNIIVLENFTFDSSKTKNYINVINNLKLNNSKTLLVMADYNEFIYKSSRNLTKSKVVTVSDVNTYEILNAQNVILLENSLGAIDNLFNKNK
jgi:large subunit ribosomal protein L4